MKQTAIPQLISLGFTETDAKALRRIAMQLHRWHEWECGVEDGGVERDEATGRCFWYSSFTGRRTPTLDRETPALKRLAKLMAGYAPLAYYVQSDPRGCAIYVLRPGDVPDGKEVESYYSRGVAVY